MSRGSREGCTAIAPVLRGVVLRRLPRGIEIVTRDRDARAERGDGHVLVRVVAGRHEHRAGNAMPLRRGGQRLPVIAARRRDETAGALLGRERCDEIEAAAQLERAERHGVLELDVHFGAERRDSSGCVTSGVGVRVRASSRRAATMSSKCTSPSRRSIVGVELHA